MRVAQQEIHRRADAGIGKVAQPAHGRLGARSRRRDRPARSGNAPPISACAARAISAVSETPSAKAAAATSALIAASRSAIVVSNSGRAVPAGGGRSRAGNRKDRRRRPGNRAPAPASTAARPAAAGRVSAATPAISARSRSAARAVERQRAAAAPSEPGWSFRPRRLPRLSPSWLDLASGNTIDDGKAGIGRRQARGGRRGISSPPWRG